MNKEELKDISYIGDGAYIGHDNYQYWLFTDNGIAQENWIALEPTYLDVVNEYAKRIEGKNE